MPIYYYLKISNKKILDIISLHTIIILSTTTEWSYCNRRRPYYSISLVITLTLLFNTHSHIKRYPTQL